MRKSMPYVLCSLLAICSVRCNPSAGDNSSAVFVTAAFEEQSGGGTVGFISDVVNSDGTVSDDFYTIRLESRAKVITSAPSNQYTVHLTSYTVQFTRPDGHNEPGVDVPFPFSLAIGGTLPPNGDDRLHTLFVPKDAKIQSPLRDLWFTNSRIYATITATVYGRDEVENNVFASASTVIVFEDTP